MHQKVPAGFGGRLRGKGPHQRNLTAQPIMFHHAQTRPYVRQRERRDLSAEGAQIMVIWLSGGISSTPGKHGLDTVRGAQAAVE